MTVAELKEMLDDYGDHLTVIFKWEDYAHGSDRVAWYQVDGEAMGAAAHETLVLDLEKVAAPE